LATIIIAVLVLGGCAPAATTDAPTKAAMEALLASDEFTQEERDCVESIKVHNNVTTVWLKKDFTSDGKKISEYSAHIAEQFAHEFYKVAKEYKYREPRYIIYVYMKLTDSEGTKKINPCDAWYDNQKDVVEVEQHGLGEFKGEIR
jgi:hypothetical protein